MPTGVHSHAHTYARTQTVNELQHCRDIAVSEETCCVQFHLLQAEDSTEGRLKTVYYTLPEWLTGYALSKMVS